MFILLLHGTFQYMGSVLDLLNLGDLSTLAAKLIVVKK
jgi:hypothetical protein